MTDLEPPVRRLIAGALGPERRPFHKDPDEPRWFEPIHVRTPGVAREAMARSVAAGADALVAPTWLTHRRALLPVGETRRAAAWTAAAVRVAREAVDRGLELRQRAAEEAAERAGSTGKDADGAGVPRNPVLVAGVVPFLGGVEKAEAGKLAPRAAGVARDLRAATGLLAESKVDVLLVDGGPAVAGARAAADAAVETGLPAWVLVPVSGGAVPSLPSGEAIEAWATSMIHAGVAGFLLMPSPGADVAGALERLLSAGVAAGQTGVLPMLLGASSVGGAGPVGAPTDDDPPGWSWMRDARPGARGASDAPDTTGDPGAERTRLAVAATRWMEAGAWHLGLLDGATPERLAAMRAAMDAVDGARLAARAASRGRWVALVEEAARRAPGGRAAWIGPQDPDVPLPTGFAWTMVSEAAGMALPAGELRLVIAATPLPARRLATLLEPGGILLARDVEPAEVSAAGLRLLDVLGEPRAILARKDP